MPRNLGTFDEFLVDDTWSAWRRALREPGAVLSSIRGQAGRNEGNIARFPVHDNDGMALNLMILQEDGNDAEDRGRNQGRSGKPLKPGTWESHAPLLDIANAMDSLFIARIYSYMIEGNVRLLVQIIQTAWAELLPSSNQLPTKQERHRRPDYRK